MSLSENLKHIIFKDYLVRKNIKYLDIEKVHGDYLVGLTAIPIIFMRNFVMVDSDWFKLVNETTSDISDDILYQFEVNTELEYSYKCFKNSNYGKSWVIQVLK